MTNSGTLSTRRLVLEPHPASASAARRWVREELHRVGHDDLSEAAELATSELVTNSILHAQTTVTVSLDPTSDRCRISIHDLSPRPVAQVRSKAGQVWSSGRGLQILSLIASCWGVDEDPPGKQVWFEPRAVEHRGHRSSTPTEPDRTPPPERPSLRRAELRQAPVALLRQARQRLADLQREMLLIVFTLDDEPHARPPSSSNVPARLVELVELAEAIEPITADLLPDELSTAAAAGDTATLRCPFPADAADVASWPDLLDEADDYCRAEQLLTLAAPRSEALARRWFLTEIVRQNTGLAPLAWPAYLATA